MINPKENESGPLMAWGERLKAHWNVYSRVDAFIFISVFGHCAIHFPVICAPSSGPHSVLQRHSERCSYSEEQGQKENIKSKIIKRFSSSLNNYCRVGYSKYDTYHDERLSLLQFDCPHITPIESPLFPSSPPPDSISRQDSKRSRRSGTFSEKSAYSNTSKWRDSFGPQLPQARFAYFEITYITYDSYIELSGTVL